MQKPISILNSVFGYFSECNKRRQFRTYDGSCNNMRYPDWGKSFTAQERYIDAQYDNGKAILSQYEEGVCILILANIVGVYSVDLGVWSEGRFSSLSILC